MSGLRSIVYVSTAVRLMGEAELEGLLTEARALNLESGTTGVLLYSEGSFMQCIEAERADVYVTYERVRASRRHTGLIELIDEPVAARTFGDWQMGFARAARSDLLAMSSARWQQHVDDATGQPISAGLMLLREFWERNRR
jgi:hypothetical protein